MCRKFVDQTVTPFIQQIGSKNGQLSLKEDYLKILEESDKIGIRTLGIPEKFGGFKDPQTEVRTFALFLRRLQEETRFG